MRSVGLRLRYMSGCYYSAATATLHYGIPQACASSDLRRTDMSGLLLCL